MNARLLLLCLPLTIQVATAQSVYRCGSNGQTSYQQAPCPEGRAVDVSDPRTAEQKAQADENTRRTAKDAREMEQQRLKEQAMAQREAKLRAALEAKAAAASRKKASAPHKPMVIRLKPKKDKDPATEFGVGVAPTPKR